MIWNICFANLTFCPLSVKYWTVFVSIERASKRGVRKEHHRLENVMKIPSAATADNLLLLIWSSDQYSTLKSTTYLNHIGKCSLLLIEIWNNYIHKLYEYHCQQPMDVGKTTTRMINWILMFRTLDFIFQLQISLYLLSIVICNKLFDYSSS